MLQKNVQTLVFFCEKKFCCNKIQIENLDSQQNTMYSLLSNSMTKSPPRWRLRNSWRRFYCTVMGEEIRKWLIRSIEKWKELDVYNFKLSILWGFVEQTRTIKSRTFGTWTHFEVAIAYYCPISKRETKTIKIIEKWWPLPWLGKIGKEWSWSALIPEVASDFVPKSKNERFPSSGSCRRSF